ncbi:MAG: maleate cis-trans isomerase family protein, partial [Hyphomicrobiales bacterium]
MAETARTDDTMILAEHLPFELDGGIAERARIGLVTLATDYTIEYEWRRLLGLPGVAVYGARILNSNQITPETLRAMEPRISKTADLILPGAELDVLAYGCTSATMTLGEEVVFERLKAARPSARFTTPITGAFAAFEALGARRIGVLTPYRADVNQIVADYIIGRGFEVPVFGSFNEERDDLVARIDAASLKSGIEHICALADVDAVFVSCTSVR